MNSKARPWRYRPVQWGVLVWLLLSPLQAAEWGEPAWLTTSVGDGSIFGSGESGLAGIDYRFEKSFHGLHPKLLFARSTAATNYLQLGLLCNWDVTRRVRLTFSSGPGLYQRNHSQRDLNYWIQFYSALEFSVRLPTNHRIGVSFGHLSNASLRHPNPGAEVLSLTYSIPLVRH
jgi:hypothetical protein